MKEKLVKLGLTEDLALKVVDGFGDIVDGLYVTKERFNEVIKERNTANDTIKERDTQIANLGKDAKDIEDLKTKVKDLEASNKTKDKEKEDALNAERKSNAIKLELAGKVHDTDMVMSLLKLDDIIMDESGKVKSGLKEQLDGVKKSKDFLFKPEQKPGTQQGQQLFVKGATPKEGEGAQPTDLSAGEIMAKSLAANVNANVKKTAESTYFGE